MGKTILPKTEGGRVADLEKRLALAEKNLARVASAIPNVYTPPWTDSGWKILGVDIPYLGGHTNYGAPFGVSGEVGIRRLPSGLVIGKGLIVAGSGPMFTLPAGFRPASTPSILIFGSANNAADESARLSTVANAQGLGEAAWTFVRSTGWTWMSLAGFTWFAEQ
jgi:hypothetical protein